MGGSICAIRQRMMKNTMNGRQSEIAGESFAASLLARAGYDVLVQYGANQPHYDLVAVKDTRILLISVKANQDGGWPIAINSKTNGMTRHQAIHAWRERQREDLVFFFVQFIEVELAQAPRTYVARPNEIELHLLNQHSGNGDRVLYENYQRDYPRSKRIDNIPELWTFSQARIDTV
jgi:Holliday junction resolvase-like predicted endonuclease